ncbi:exopolysaccharide biosynthesis protein [Frigidibacter sp. MR17.24]|uniref:exopolysaccharide biosynthesis protein n=1 Tax=Frigidibacter sp. MR17.24 TaxID=3127345 RepID=UPI003012E066
MTADPHFADTDSGFAAALDSTIRRIDGDSITLRRLMAMIGEQGLLMISGLASLPFLLPVSIPGVSTVFGLAIVLIALAITLNRMPWLPERVLDRDLPAAKLRAALERGAGIVARVERFVKPRLTGLTTPGAVARWNGVMLMLAGILLMAPFGFVPFSNTLPGIAVLLLSLGMMQRDGAMVIAGYAFNVITIVYFGALIWLAWVAGTGIGDRIAG